MTAGAAGWCAEELRLELTKMWERGDRAATLARIGRHCRGFEGWWKFEVATCLWEFAARRDAYVFVEALDAADIVIGLAAASTTAVLDPSRSPCIPIELKVVSTAFNRSNEKAAYADSSKKCLAADMARAADRSRSAHPFSVVGLLVTHQEELGAAVLARFLDHPRRLAREHGLTELLNEPITLPAPGLEEGSVVAHQFFWLAETS